MNEQEILAKMRSGNFTENNGIVLRAINIGRTGYNKLSNLRDALQPDIDRTDFSDAINYLFLSGYIDLRRSDTKTPANIADDNIEDIEAKVSAAGIRLLAGKAKDDCVRT
jgi:hypothetical protein